MDIDGHSIGRRRACDGNCVAIRVGAAAAVRNCQGHRVVGWWVEIDRERWAGRCLISAATRSHRRPVVSCIIAIASLKAAWTGDEDQPA